jgi:hypothetical protein
MLPGKIMVFLRSAQFRYEQQPIRPPFLRHQQFRTRQSVA